MGCFIRFGRPLLLQDRKHSCTPPERAIGLAEWGVPSEGAAASGDQARPRRSAAEAASALLETPSRL
jgi:hypothetical protein